MPRKHYTQKGLATSVRLARERAQRIERERVEAEEKRALEGTSYVCGCCGFSIRTIEPLSTCLSCGNAVEDATARIRRERRERDYIDCGIAQFEAMLAGHRD